MRLSDFDLYSDLLARESGMALSEEQSFLLDSRLQPVARKWGYFSPAAMGLALRAVPDTALVRDVVEAMMSHDTSFFRDKEPFSQLRDTLLPVLAADDDRLAQRKLRFWSAGCATGQEAYSLALTARDCPALSGWIVETVGTDISGKVLDRAREGLYTSVAVQQGIPVQTLINRFDQEKDGKWRVRHDIRRDLSFIPHNLIHDMGALGRFDVICCRYVLDRMTAKARADILRRMADRLAPDGILILGPQDTIPPDIALYRPVRLFPGLYVRTENKHAYAADESGAGAE